MKPEFLFLDINKRCNLKCLHCNFHERQNSKKQLTLNAIRNLLLEFSEVAHDNQKKLVICGGEPMLDLDRYLFAATEAKKLNFKVLSVVHGGQINNKNIKLICDAEIDEISISFDSYIQSIHDKLRGIDGAYNLAMRGVNLLLKHRKSTKVNIMALIHNQSYNLVKWYKWANEIGVDKLKLNFIQPTFGGTSLEDNFFKEYSQINPKSLASKIQEAESELGIKFNPEWIDAAIGYFDNIYQNKELNWNTQLDIPLCNSYERNLMVDSEGHLGFCFAPCSSIRPKYQYYGDIHNFIFNTLEQRKILKEKGCFNICGISHSVRKVSCYAK